jgi:hypothetical protein
MLTDTIKKDIQLLATAQAAFESDGWENVGSIQRGDVYNSQAWGTIYKKNNRQFFLNINSASKAIQFIQKIP